VDLLVHEAYFADEADDLPTITGHSWLHPVAEVAAAADVGRLVLVHINPLSGSDAEFDLSAARRLFKDIEFGVDQMELEF
jgi:ribonuclease BN (tRNA processing enzyme)